MGGLPEKYVALLTIYIGILQFTEKHRVSLSSILVRIPPDILEDVVGKDKVKEFTTEGKKLTVAGGVRLLVDPELEEGECVTEWRQ